MHAPRKASRFPIALALLLVAPLLAESANAGMFNWGTGRMKDASDEITRNIRKILKSVKSDNRDYPSPDDFGEIVYTTADSVEIRRRFVVSDGDLVVKSAEEAIIVADGDVEIDSARNSVIIAGGKIKSRWKTSAIRNSLVLSDSRMVFEGLVEDSTLYASPGAKLFHAVNITVFSSMILEIESKTGDVKTLEGAPPF